MPLKYVQFFEFFQRKNRFFGQEKYWYFWKLDSFSNTLHRLEKWNFATVRGAFGPRTPCGGGVIALKWPGCSPLLHHGACVNNLVISWLSPILLDFYNHVDLSSGLVSLPWGNLVVLLKPFEKSQIFTRVEAQSSGIAMFRTVVPR